MENIIDLLLSLNFTISSCESITGGLFSKTITDTPNASKVFIGGLITYSTDAKINVSHIEKTLIDKYGVISPQCASSMAKNSKQIFTSDIAISFTGNAGPSNLETKSVGLVYIALELPNKSIIKEFHFKGNRKEIRNDALNEGLKILEENLIIIKESSK